MPPSDPVRAPHPLDGVPGRFTLYVEGPRDRSILRTWAYRLLPSRANALFRASVILGGRQPERAIEHFREHRAHEPGAAALCVLDRDGGDLTAPDTNGYDLDFFTWGRRHIESYLLVPSAIRRALAIPDDDHRLDRTLEEHLPGEGDAAWAHLDAKRLLGQNGPLAQVMGGPLPLAKIARATRESELDPDVLTLFERLRERVG